MINLAIIVGLLLGSDLVARAGGASPALAGRIALGAVFLFTALGHFLKTAEMAEMLPSSVPQRRLIIRLSGVLELAMAAAVIPAPFSRAAGLAICAFLLLATPANVFAAWRRIPFGGHARGPAYLALRLPLQALLFGWAYWFTLR
ncbi:MAG TPA: hypothetical protein VMI53_14150 [Opitutaceae bacterium]|nr:hypothetical protein [Opitutaceae bacterium]